MPLTYELKRTAKGREYVYVVTSGAVDESHAREFVELFGQGGRYAGLPLLSTLADDAAFTVESRKLFTSGAAALPISATVVGSAAQRVMLNFMIKASALAGAPTRSRAFSSLAEALAWMEGEMEKPHPG